MVPPMSEPPVSEPLRVPATLDGERVDRALALLTGWQRSQVQTLIEQDDVLVDGRPVAKSHRLREGSVVELLAEPELDAPPEADPSVTVDVKYADDDVIVVAKPAGLVVHPGAGHATGTLVQGLLARYPDLAEVGEEDRPGIVHRLDRDTSGLLVVARSPRAYESLVEQLTSRTVERLYIALAWGKLASSRGVIDAPIGRSESRRTRMAVRDAGKPARTSYEVRRVYDTPVCSLLDCRLETGRTHQIRVHLAAVGHPVVGDGTYGGARQPLVLGRPFLHAALLGFVHPATGETLQFEEPLPAELADVLAQLDGEGGVSPA
jgi:23S rRNA pseudouridine1911/1915/1917 synthase